MNPGVKQCGSVIEYDFAPRKPGIEVKVEGKILYADDYVMMARYEFSFGGKLFCCYHFMTDLATGKIAHV